MSTPLAILKQPSSVLRYVVKTLYLSTTPSNLFRKLCKAARDGRSMQIDEINSSNFYYNFEQLDLIGVEIFYGVSGRFYIKFLRSFST